jgi:hypothetical protein
MFLESSRGPYEREKENIDKTVAFAATKGFVPHGHHHEISPSDPMLLT